MKNKISVWFFFISILFADVSIEIINPTSTSKWRGVQIIEWRAFNKTAEFLGPPPGYYNIFYAPSDTPTPLPSEEPPQPPWVKINTHNIPDDGIDHTSYYSFEWNLESVQTGHYKVLIKAYNPNDDPTANGDTTLLVDNTLPTVSVSFEPNTPDGNNGWYKTAPEVTITVSDDDAGPRSINPIRYKIGSGSYTWAPTSPYTFTAIEGETLYVYGYDDAVDKDGNSNESDQLVVPEYKVDLTPPNVEINVDYGNKKFSITTEDNTSGIDWSNVKYEFILQDDTILGPYDYSEGSIIDIPEDVKTIRAYSMDNAGNVNSDAKTFSTNRKISGYVKDFKGNPISNIKVIITGDIHNTTSTNSSGYYEFTGLDDFGNYYVAPITKNNMPTLRIYDGLGEDKTNQNFVIVDGWISKKYDRGKTNDYQFSSAPILNPPVLAETYSISFSPTSILTGVLNDDKKMDILFTDGNYLRGYYWKDNSYIKRDWSPKTTVYNISLLDGTGGETKLDSIILLGKGPDVAEIYNKNGNKIKEIRRLSALPNTKWSVISVGSGNFIFFGFDEEVGTDTILFYNLLIDNTLWETAISQQIIPGTETICFNEKAAIIIGNQSDTSDLVLTAIDIKTGNSLWERVFNGQRGKIVPMVASLEEGSLENVIAIRTSTDISLGEMQVYLLNGATGEVIRQWQAPSSITPITNKNFSSAVGDIDNDGNKELVIADGSGNIYIVNLLTGSYTYALNKGKIWALVDFDGASDKKKEIIVSSGTEIKILKSDLTNLVSRDMEESIMDVVVSDTNGDDYTDIIVSLPSKLSILRAAKTSDLPATPSILDIYSNGINVYLVWSYVSNGADLSGFKIYRSTNPSNEESWKYVGKVGADINLYVDTPPPGIFSYKVAAYNDFGEKRSSASEPVEVVGKEDTGGGTSGCFIATAAFGTPMAKEVEILRKFRDKYLLTNKVGITFTNWYYRHSPKIAEYIRNRNWAKFIVRGLLRPIVWFVSIIMK